MFLVYSDLHLGPGGRDRVDELASHAAADAVEAVVVLGDVVDDNREHASTAEDGERYESRGRAFFERLAETGVPAVAVPGNHDPEPCTSRLTDGSPDAVVADRRVVDSRADHLGGADPLDGGGFVGVGCGQFDLTTGLPYRSFPSLDPLPEATAADIHRRAESVAESIEAAVGAFLVGSATAAETADALGVDASNRPRFEECLSDVEAEFEAIAALLEACPSPTVLCAHQPPFNTALDHHHSDRGPAGRVHRGSIALKMAVLHAGPELVLSGHTHARGRDAIETARGYATAYNPGAPGVAAVSLDGGAFRIENVDVASGR